MIAEAEWLETDGLGGFASGTSSGLRTRRYHGLLVHAVDPPAGRMMLVAGLDAELRSGRRTWPISSHAYAPDVVHPDGRDRIESFAHEPWPRWLYRLGGLGTIEQEIFVTHGSARTVVRWRFVREAAGSEPVVLVVRPLLAGRDYHTLHHENPSFRFDADCSRQIVRLRPYPGVPGITLRSSARYEHAPRWYRNFRYEQERARGFDFQEDLAAPGSFQFDLDRGPAVLILAAEGHDDDGGDEPAHARGDRLREAERARRSRFATSLERAADAYVVRRGAGRTLIAGYPWFADWGRDTFIALRGIALACGRYDLAREVLLEWAGSVSEGMLPNRFPDGGGAVEYNAVDASLWFVIVACELERAMALAGRPLDADAGKRLRAATEAILTGYARGTRYGIRLDRDGLLMAGEPGVQLTWMDARVEGRPITPRTGKPVEIQALWINALAAAGKRSAFWRAQAERSRVGFSDRFWNCDRGCLYDVVDVDGKAGTVDSTLRPNQILAVGGLPLPVLTGERARSVVDVVERELWTPLGLRSLSPSEPGYRARYEGGPTERDGSYHQGPAWAWLLGPFVEAWLSVRGGDERELREAYDRFYAPLLEHLGSAGLGHVSELADSEPPHTPRGCPFQAWSVGELLRIERLLGALARPGTGVAVEALSP
jgi:predicted glycogen debranching enzyme